MIVWVCRNKSGIFEDSIKVFAIEPILCDDGIYRVPQVFYGAALWSGFNDGVLKLEKGEIRAFRLERLLQMVNEKGMWSPELEELQRFEQKLDTFYITKPKEKV